MVKLAIGAVGKFIEHLLKICGPAGENQVDIIDEISRLSVQVLLTCVLGSDISDVEMEFWENGKSRRTPISFVLRDTFQKMIERYQSTHVILFPFLANWYILPHERDIKANALAVRNVVRTVIDSRRKQGTELNRGDLLSIMLDDPMFSENDEVMIDELLTIFFAGS
jgi:cytochrome P450